MAVIVYETGCLPKGSGELGNNFGNLLRLLEGGGARAQAAQEVISRLRKKVEECNRPGGCPEYCLAQIVLGLADSIFEA